MNVMRYIWILVPFFLLGCGDDSSDDLSNSIAAGNYEEALKSLTSQLEKTPADRRLNALSALAKLEKCLATNCFTDNPALLNEIKTHLSYGTEAILLENDTMLDLKAELAKLAPRVAALPHQPKPLVAMLDIVPLDARTAFADALFTKALTLLRQADFASAEDQLSIIASSTGLVGEQQKFATLLYAILTGDADQVESYTIALRSRQKGADIPLNALRMLPLTYFSQVRHDPNGTYFFLTGLNDFLTSRQLTSLFAAEGGRAIAEEVRYIGTAPSLRQLALNHFTAAPTLSGEMIPIAETNQPAPATTADPVSGTTEVADNYDSAATLLDLYLTKLSLVIDPDQPSVWIDFLPKAEKYVTYTGDVGLITQNINANLIPAAARDAYNNRLFRVIETFDSQGENVLPLLSQLATKDIDKATLVRLEKMVQVGLETAVQNEQTDLVIAYADFRPEIARNSRQIVVPLIIDSIRYHFAEDNMEEVVKLGDFLTQDMRIDFNLDAVILQGFEKHLTEAKVAETLNADDVLYLVQPQEVIQVDLGPKFDFLKTYFADQPDVVNSQLKNLVVAANGAYGTANAMYRLFHLFIEEDFSTDEREQYLVNTLQNSLAQDLVLQGSELADIGYQLHTLHPKLPLSFVINEALSRLKTLDDSRLLWQQATADYRDTIQIIRPQFSALMQAIDAFEAGDKQQAASMFATLTNTFYLDLATPYIEEYLSTLRNYAGIYAPNITHNSKLPTGLIVLDPAGNDISSADLAQMNIGFVNLMGTHTTNNPTTFVTNAGAVYHATLQSALDFNTQSITLTETDRDTAEFDGKFEEVFGPIEHIKLTGTNQEPTLTMTITGGQPITFERIAATADSPLFPDGRYGITQQLSQSVAQTDRILPPGALIELKTDQDHPLQPMKGPVKLPVIYKVTGEIWHPATLSPQPITGYYQTETHLTLFTFTYPLAHNQGSVQAAAKCHIIAHNLLCGSHNLHNNRTKFTHQVLGRQTAESIAEQAELLRLKELEADESDFLKLPTPQEILPPPVFDDIE